MNYHCLWTVVICFFGLSVTAAFGGTTATPSSRFHLKQRYHRIPKPNGINKKNKRITRQQAIRPSFTKLTTKSHSEDVATSAALTGGGGGVGDGFPTSGNTTEDTAFMAAQAAANNSTLGNSNKNKSPEDYAFMKNALLDNVMFTTLPPESLQTLMDCFEFTTVQQNTCIVAQGDQCEGDYVYLVAKGECTVLVDGKVVPEPYGTLKAKSIFGELGVLYNQTRAATIVAKSPEVQLWRIQGETFKGIMNSGQFVKSGGSSNAINNNNPDCPDLLEQLRQIDQAINQVAGTKSLYGGDIIRVYRPNRAWLWSRWKGTVLQHSYRTVALNMGVSILFILLARKIAGVPAGSGFGLAPDHAHPFIQRLDILRKLWSYQMTLTTFILTFFVNQAYGFWQEIHSITRRIQGRMNDFHLLLATNAKRHTDGTFTSDSEKLMDDISAFSRLFHVLYWASTARRFAVLRTPKGLERMASRGLMTSRQLKVIEGLDVPSNQRHNACLEWMMVRANQGMEDGTLKGDTALRQRLMIQMCELRATYATIGDKLSCRMPLPYTHFVQILVDTFVLLSPMALYPEMGAFSVLCVGMLTLFYNGLLDLAKVFLDPLDNEDFTKNSIDMDLGVLIRESNAGSTRWKNSGANLPFDLAPPTAQPQ